MDCQGSVRITLLHPPCRMRPTLGTQVSSCDHRVNVFGPEGTSGPTRVARTGLFSLATSTSASRSYVRAITFPRVLRLLERDSTFFFQGDQKSQVQVVQCNRVGD